MEHNITIYEVARTGKLDQFYTLYIYRSWGNDTMSFCKYSFRQNLSVDLDKALEKAKRMAGTTAEVEYVDTPRVEYEEFKAFDLKWRNGRNCYFAEPDKNFWGIWKQHKEALKNMGFWVSKNDSGFMVFCRLDEAKGLVELPKYESKEVPTIENGRQELTAKLLKTKINDGFYGVTTRGTFQLTNGYKINGTLPKAINELSDENRIGKTFSFMATIEDQGEGFGFYKRPTQVKF